MSSKIPAIPCLIAAAGALMAGCSDDLSPTLGTLRVELTSSIVGATDDVDLFVDGEAVTDSLAGDVVELRLEPGAYTVTAVPADTCATADPARVELRVEAGRTAAARFRILVGSGLTVTSNVAGLPILIDGEMTGKVTPATITCVTPGSHTVELELPCSGTGQTVSREVEAIEDSVVTSEVVVPTLTVLSNSPCLDVWLDGEPTGRRAGEALACIEPGTHTVSVVLEGESLATTEIEMEDEPLEIRLDVPVVKPVVLEVLGWVTCSFCPAADEATYELVRDPEFVGRIHRLEIHQEMPNRFLDIFGNAETQFRYGQYPMQEGAPFMVFDGGAESVRGVPGGDTEALYQNLAGKARSLLQDAESSWLILLKDLEEVQPYDPGAVGGEIHRLTACVSVVAPPQDPAPVLYAFACKTDIQYTNPVEPQQTVFHDVVRTIEGPIPLNEAPYGLDQPGEAAEIDLEFRFPTGEVDHRGDPWDFGGYTIVVLIQSAQPYPQGRILQSAQVAWDR